MSLLMLKNFIAKHKIVSSALLLQQFNGAQQEIQAWLELLIHKGYVQRCEQKPACQTKCFKCQPAQIAFYQWIEPQKS